MSSQVNEALEHWPHVAPLLTAPRNDTEYAALVEALDEVLDAGGADEAHPLATLADRMGELIEEYEDAKDTQPSVTGVDALRFLMQEHAVKQSDLPEVGSQSVVSEVLSGRRRLNVRQIAALVRRFGVSADVFIDPRHLVRDHVVPEIALRSTGTRDAQTLAISSESVQKGVVKLMATGASRSLKKSVDKFNERTSPAAMSRTIVAGTSGSDRLSADDVQLGRDCSRFHGSSRTAGPDPTT